ncbi:hypothetical protein AAE478_008566 [Parahypoxylon ruwenzoriense]
MSGRRRPASSRAESAGPVIDPVTRQTRSSARRLGASVEPELRTETQIAQRGTRRKQRRKSIESVATADLLKSPADYASPEPENRGILEPHVHAAFEAGDAYESPDMEVARIEDMLEFDIPKLLRCSTRIYGILSSISDSSPSTDNLLALNSTRKLYASARLPFADNHALFIDSTNLARGCNLGVQAKVRLAAYTGNLISLLIYIWDVKQGKREPLSILEELDDAFPALFAPDLRVNADDTARILDLAFRIRWRRLAALLAVDSTVKPFEMIASVFCDQPVRDAKKDAKSASSVRTMLRKGQYKQLAGIEVNEDTVSREIYHTRIEGLISKLSHNDKLEMQISLDQTHPQEKLLADLKSWALDIFGRLHTLSSQGNVQATSPPPELHRLEGGEESDSLFVGNSNTINPHETEEDSDSVSETQPGEYARLPLQNPEYVCCQVSYTRTWDMLIFSSQNFIDNSAVLAAVRQSEKNAREGSATTSFWNQGDMKGKEVAPSIEDAIRRLDPKRTLINAQKRPCPSRDTDGEEERGEDNDDGNDNDDGFELNEYLERPRRVQHEGAATQPLSGKPEAHTSREITGSQPLDHLPDDDQVRKVDYKTLSQEARNGRRAYTPPMQRQRQRQTRIPWTSSDTARLLALIADPSKNCSWSAMAETGGFEIPRNQQALRDKARNMKVLYLEADRILPTGFDQVVLGRKEKDSVIAAGRNPDRMEDDIDRHGNVINNIWAG